ncbi:aminoglycoside phosphotransferase family protein [Streptomyces sp. 7-21]|uniref:aminoglycoside phosphotransferase family protein n=1 Tax=Streptomyces sp. 7-21 TaxID=2802283 RepID=UPI00191FD281|nr:aminoglycoside phosphotransferase family protein [Streptomyces sp. 7-21]MBL1068533.1 aminoglycoside phosphotransferase family protein [Streptomyces sp. 7-21]
MSQQLTRTTTLRGHHRVWQILRPQGELAALGRLKAARPRLGVHRFDPRCFRNEEDLLIELALLGFDRVPPVYRLSSSEHGDPADIRVHGYIEGTVLSALRPKGTSLARVHLRQLASLFGQMAAVPPSALTLVHSCPPGKRPRTSAEFLHSLLRFTRTRVWHTHRPQFGSLFASLGIDPGVLAPDGPLGRAAGRLTDRPFCLLHGDLHRDNLIVGEDDGSLWTIDWELALLGDPVYDLATHLHLMGYPRAQEHAMVVRWAGAMETARPGAADGLVKDLPRYLAYKRVQSVFTDVIRQGMAVREAPAELLPEQLERAGHTVAAVLRNAAGPLGLRRPPGHRVVEGIYAGYAAAARQAGTAPAAGPASQPAAEAPQTPSLATGFLD